LDGPPGGCPLLYMEMKGVDLPVKNIPERLKKWFRNRARIHHRSPQDERKAIIRQQAVRRERRRLGPEEVHRRVRELGLRTGAEAVEMLREDRDAH